MKKKSLLFAAGLLLSISAFTQQRALPPAVKLTPNKPYEAIINDHNAETASPRITNSGIPYNRSGELLKVDISSSSNIYGIFNADQRVLSAQPEANLITFGNRAGGSFGATGNDLAVAYSTDLGSSWTNFVVNPDAGLNFRYPSTTTYNPEGNSDLNNIAVIYSGPYTDAAGWKGQFLGSANMDGSNVQTTFMENESSVYINHLNIGLTATSTGNIHVASTRLNGDATVYTNEGWEVLNGVYNSDTRKIDMELPVVKVIPELLEDGRTDADCMVFSPDGSIGYLFATAIDADLNYNPYGVEWPVVYKTVDHGQNWEKIPEFDFSEINAFKEYLYPTRADENVIIPRWYNKWASEQNQRTNGATVDINGNLHIAGLIRSTNSIHPDSLAYFYTNEPLSVFDVFMNGDGTWNAQFIDTLRSDVYQTVFTGVDGVDLDQRIGMSRTKSGDKVFVTWADTDAITWGVNITTNKLPDIYIWSKDVINNTYTPAVNVTTLSDYWGANLWMHQSDMVIEDGGNYYIPVSTSVHGTTDLDPVLHQYLKNVWFTEGDYINVGTASIASPVAGISQNYPNPVNGTTRVDVTLTKNASVSLEVYNIVGQKVYEIPARNLTEGTHSFEISVTGLKAGVYTYSVIANGERTTRKMMVN